MDGEIPILPGLRIPAAELDESASRSGGPGGQHVNKTSTRIQLRWSPASSAALLAALGEERRGRLVARLAGRLTQDGELIVVVDSERSQIRNRQEARERLAEILRRALQTRRPRVPTKRTAGSVRRRIGAKKKRAETKRGRGRVGEEG
jgi:ribosome-associated protein